MYKVHKVLYWMLLCCRSALGCSSVLNVSICRVKVHVQFEVIDVSPGTSSSAIILWQLQHIKGLDRRDSL